MSQAPSLVPVDFQVITGDLSVQVHEALCRIPTDELFLPRV